jgi:hypothetical protein
VSENSTLDFPDVGLQESITLDRVHLHEWNAFRAQLMCVNIVRLMAMICGSRLILDHRRNGVDFAVSLQLSPHLVDARTWEVNVELDAAIPGVLSERMSMHISLSSRQFPAFCWSKSIINTTMLVRRRSDHSVCRQASDIFFGPYRTAPFETTSPSASPQ